MNFNTIVFVLAIIATALISGLYYSYSCSVNPGLARLSDAGYLSAMQSINRAILNPAFFSSFFGALILLFLAAYLNYSANNTRFYLLAAAAALYAIASFGVTMFGNVPLNEALDKLHLSAMAPEEITITRLQFEAQWNKWHAIRTAASVISLMLAVTAAFFHAPQREVNWM